MFDFPKVSKRAQNVQKHPKSKRIQSVQKGLNLCPNLCNLSKIVKRCPKYQKGSKAEKIIVALFLGHPADASFV